MPTTAMVTPGASTSPSIGSARISAYRAATGSCRRERSAGRGTTRSAQSLSGRTVVPSTA
jgi:hypothetical protein